uniref:Low density lipoprotein receptor adaptor protein 1 n=1 Tax=Strix occidentalis caurina TaxID=311401 RepID=A0A8D0KVL3_STROC
MDALKSAGRALLRSPSVHKPSWAGGRHKKLPENWTDTRETLLEGMLFSLKYMGMTLVEQPKGEELSAAAVKRIVATAKASGKKLQKVTLKVSPRGIVLNDSGTNELIENVSIYRWVTGWGGALQWVHVPRLLVCSRLHPVSSQGKERRDEPGGVVRADCRSTAKHSTATPTGNLLDLEDPAKSPLTSSTNSPHVDNSMFGPSSSAINCTDLCSYFLFFSPLRLAQSRTNPHVLDTGLTAQDIQSAETLSPVDWNKIDSNTGEKDDLFMF